MAKTNLKSGLKLSKLQALIGVCLLAVVGIFIVFISHAGASGIGGPNELDWQLSPDHPSQDAGIEMDNGVWRPCAVVSTPDANPVTATFTSPVGNSYSQQVLPGDQQTEVCAKSFKVSVQYNPPTINYAVSVSGGNLFVYYVYYSGTVEIPTNLHIPSSTSTSASLAWDSRSTGGSVGSVFSIPKAMAGSGITFNIYRNGQKIGTSTTTTYTDSGLTAGKYSYQVSAVDADGTETDLSDPSEYTISQAVSFYPPTGVKAGNITDTGFHISWLAPKPSTPLATPTYQVYRVAELKCQLVNGKLICPPKFPDDVLLGETSNLSLDVTGEKSGEIHQYYVEAVYQFDDGSKGGAGSDNISVRTLDKVAPTTPTGLVITRRGHRNLSLSWNPSSDNSGISPFYSVYRNGKLIAHNLGGTVFTDSKLRPDTTYGYYVQAVDDANNQSAVSATVFGKTKPVPPRVTCGWDWAHGWPQYVCKPVKK